MRHVGGDEGVGDEKCMTNVNFKERFGNDGDQCHDTDGFGLFCQLERPQREQCAVDAGETTVYRHIRICQCDGDGDGDG